MQTRKILFFFLLLGFLSAASADDAIYSKDFCLSFYPEYPPIAGQEITLRLRTFKPAQRVTLYSERNTEVPMTFRQGFWWGRFSIPKDYKEGSHYFTVRIKYPDLDPPKPADLISSWLSQIGIKKTQNALWSKSTLWYQMVKQAKVDEVIATGPPPPADLTNEAEEEIPPVTGEAIEIKIPSVEVSPFIVKGTKTLTFTSKSIEGTKESFVPGVAREEALRLNISGKSEDIEVDANLISTSTAGTSQVAQREEKMTVLLKKGSMEAYLGDFTADFNETEFTRLSKMLSGVRARGEWGRFGFNALYSSPKGEARFSRMYGDGTQGPFKLEAAPVVINSERVYLDGISQKRGDDYLVDYQAGTITFIKQTIDPRSILNIYYDYRQSVYAHSTSGARLTLRPAPGLKIGASYLDDSDSVSGAEEIRQNMQTLPVDPQGHSVFGFDGSLVSESLLANAEVAYSRRNLNLLSSGNERSGAAAKVEMNSQWGPFGLVARGKRVGSTFELIADPLPKQNIIEYGGLLSFRHGPLLGAQGSYDYNKYQQAGVVYENSYKNTRAALTPERFPSLEYNFTQNFESNDPVTGGAMLRTITRDSAETNYRLGFLAASLKGTVEKWLKRSPTEEVTDYRRVNFGLATLGLNVISFASNLEWEDRQEPSGAKPYRRTCNLNLSASPGKAYFVSAALEYLDDSAQGLKNVTDLSYRAEPNEYFKTDGKYTITSVNEDYATAETVSKQAGSFSIDLRPFRFLRLRYLFKPNFTRIIRNQALAYNNEQQQAEANFIPLKEMLLGVILKTGRNYNVYKYDYPGYAIKQNSADTDSALYTLKTAPLNFLSTEFNYLIEKGISAALITSEPLSYLPGRSAGEKIDLAARTSLSERFAIDSRFIYQKNTQGSGEASANLMNGFSRTASLKGTWNISDLWSVSVSGAYAKALDFLSSSPVTYTVSPGCGFIYRQGEKLRIDFDYVYSRSYAGAVTERTNISLRGKYSLSDYVNITLRGEQELSKDPDYRLTDISGNIEINL
jgi:hypothetical protein